MQRDPGVSGGGAGPSNAGGIVALALADINFGRLSSMLWIALVCLASASSTCVQVGSFLSVSSLFSCNTVYTLNP